MKMNGIGVPRRLAALLAATLLGCGGSQPNPARELPLYRIVLPELAPPGAGVNSSVAFAINGRDEIVGTVETASGRHAYRSSLQPGGPSSGLLPGGQDGIAYNVNEQGLVVGAATIDGQRRALSWQAGVAMPLPGLDAANAYGESYGVNDAGEVVGVVGRAEQPLAALWRQRQLLRLLPLDPAHPTSEAYAINRDGVAVGGSATASGYVPVLWSRPDQVLALGGLPEAPLVHGVALAVSSARHVTGVTSSKEGPRAFLWHAGVMRDLGDLPGGGAHSIGYGVNKHGHVVGSSQVKHGSGPSQSATLPALLHHPFLWTPAAGMVDLNTRIAPDDPLRGKVELLESAVITDDGKITGRALVDGVVRAYVLIPLSARP